MNRFCASASRVAIMAALLAPGAALAENANVAAEQTAGREAEPSRDDASVSTIIVTGKTTVQVATKADLPIIEAPQAISIVTSELIERRGYDDAVDALENVAGVNILGQFESGQILAFRGFFANGFNASRIDDSRFNFRVASLDPELIERMEFLKGPSSVLYGTADAGGVVNVKTKSPTKDFQSNVMVSGGSFDRFAGSADISGPITADGRLSGRVVVSQLESDSFIDFVGQNRTSAMGAIAFEPTDRTELMLKAIYQDTDDFQPQVLPLMSDGSIPDIPRSRFLGPAINSNQYEQAVLQFNGTHRFNDVLRLEARASYVRAERASESTYVYSYGGVPASGDTYAYGFFTGDTREDYAAELRLHADFTFLGMETSNLIGVEYFQNDTVGPGNLPTIFLGNLNIFDSAPFPITDPAFATNRSFTQAQEFYGIFAQSTLKPTDRLTIVLSGRVDDLSLGGTRTIGANTNTTTDIDTSDFTYRIGSSYEILDGLFLYGSYGTSFEPPTARDANENLLPPVTGEAIEAGLKADLFDGRGLFTLALYDIARQNIAQRDPANPFASIAVGEQTHRGVEVEVQAEPVRGLQVLATYSYIDAEFTRDTSGLQGLRPFGIPEHTINFWASYTIQQGPLAGLGFNGGLRIVDEVFVDNANDFTLPSYERVDLSIFYRPENRPYSIALNVENALDTRYAANPRGSAGYAFSFGAPRNAVVRLRYDF